MKRGINMIKYDDVEFSKVRTGGCTHIGEEWKDYTSYCITLKHKPTGVKVSYNVTSTCGGLELKVLSAIFKLNDRVENTIKIENEEHNKLVQEVVAQVLKMI